MELDLTRWTDRYMPENVLNMSALSPQELVHCRVFVCINLFTLVLCALHAVIFTLINLLSDLDFGVVITMGVLCALSSFLVYYFFYRTGRFKSAAMLFSTAYIVETIACVVITGGPKSPLMPVLISSPVIAFVISGRHEGLYNSLVIFFLAAMMVILDSLGFPYLQLLPAGSYNSIFLSAWVVAILLNLGCLSAYLYFSEQVYVGKSGRMHDQRR